MFRERKKKKKQTQTQVWFISQHYFYFWSIEQGVEFKSSAVIWCQLLLWGFRGCVIEFTSHWEDTSSVVIIFAGMVWVETKTQI